MTTDTFQRKLTAILSADVAGYSRLMGEDEAATVKTLEIYKGVMFSLIKQHRGRVVDSPGDNLLAEFGSVVDAVQCAVSIQKELQTRNADLPENRRMEFRIGINLGDVIEEDDRIYGDGVNIAARLEALADPGGICISKTAFDYIENKLPFGYRFIGDQTVKNIAKPIGAYKVIMETRLIDEEEQKAKTVSFWQRKAVLSFGIILILVLAGILYWNFYLRGISIEPASIDRMAYPLPDKPSIAVLPFTNMSGDPEQEYIGDGLSENIISALSVSSQMFVMARNATFTYKGTPVKPQQVAEDLGVQYVLEGSIQKSGDQMRVTAQLIDALNGHHLWSEVYNRKMEGLFDLQDEITKKIMVSLQAELTWVGEDIRFLAKSTDNLEAWKHFIKGRELYEHFIEQDSAKARQHLERALELDPQYVPAMSQLGFVHLIESFMGWSDSPSASMDRAFKLAQKAVEMDDQDPMGHCLLGYVFLWQRQHEKAIFEGKRAITLGPNFALVCGVLGHIMSFSGHFNDAIPILKKGYRLNPNLDPVFLNGLAQSYIFLARYEEALEVCNEMEEKILNGRLRGYDWFPSLFSSWVYQELDREEEARAYMAEALKREPDLSSELYKRIFPYKNHAHLERALDALCKAGMPEREPGTVQEKPSIAVLPFDDLSPEKDQEYFVLGLSEEVLNSLAQISDLTVIAKTSSFSFKGKDKTIQEIASVLGVDHILEGSVRKAGNALRITAQLVKAVDGSHLWSKTYDRDLKVKEIFSVQEDIARAVADGLKITLGIEPFKQLGGTDNMEAYELYLLAKGLYFTNNTRALESIDRAIALDREFALAWAYKALLHWETLIYAPANIAPFERDASLNAALRSIELEPNLGEAYLSLGLSRLLRAEFIKAELAYRKGMELTAESINPWEYGICIHYDSVGHFKRAHEIIEAARRNDPLNKVSRAVYMSTLGLLGHQQGAEEEYERGKALFGDDWYWGDRFITWIRLGARDVVSRNDIPAADLIHDVAKEYLKSPEEGLAELHRLYIGEDNLHSGNFACIALWAAYFGDPEFALNAMERSIRLQASALWLIWHPVMEEVRQLPGFKGFVQEIGLMNYWNQFGWPDLCRPVGDDDFECD